MISKPRVKQKDFLYKNFLHKKTIYGQNESYWRKIIHKILNKHNVKPQPWIINEYANGQKIYNGNPIYSARVLDGKAIRIIQEEPKSELMRIAAWVDEAEDGENGKLIELVIALELTKETKAFTLMLIEKWVSEGTTAGIMTSFIEEKLP